MLQPGWSGGLGWVLRVVGMGPGLPALFGSRTHGCKPALGRSWWLRRWAQITELFVLGVEAIYKYFSLLCLSFVNRAHGTIRCGLFFSFLLDPLQPLPTFPFLITGWNTRAVVGAPCALPRSLWVPSTAWLPRLAPHAVCRTPFSPALHDGLSDLPWMTPHKVNVNRA